MKRLFLALLFTISLSFLVYSQENNQKKTNQIYIETDPTTYFFNGYSLVIRRSSTFADNLNIGIGIYSAVLPKEFIERIETQKGKGWEVKNMGYDLFFDYNINNPNKGLTAGAIMSIYNYDISRIDKEERITSFVPTLRVGYLWRPLPEKLNGLYIYPWAGVSTDVQIAGKNEIDGEKFELPKWSFVPSIQIGYSF